MKSFVNKSAVIFAAVVLVASVAAISPANADGRRDRGWDAHARYAHDYRHHHPIPPPHYVYAPPVVYAPPPPPSPGLSLVLPIQVY